MGRMDFVGVCCSGTSHTDLSATVVPYEGTSSGKSHHTTHLRRLLTVTVTQGQAFGYLCSLEHDDDYDNDCWSDEGRRRTVSP